MKNWKNTRGEGLVVIPIKVAFHKSKQTVVTQTEKEREKEGKTTHIFRFNFFHFSR